jgi:UV DNA damage repair endonuclease
MLRIPYDYDTKISIEVEAKAKEAAIKKLQYSYKNLF